ncbi:hypothetical protein EDB87DRAFT_1826000 [Lactarius vividus]|nr:hypothetical protein EDB87DRAFT_1826000 [Lactarius vividus]
MPGNAVVDIRNTYGCSFIRMVISIMLFDITILQTWIYYWQYGNRDPKTLMLFIAVIFIVDTLHTVLCIYSVYWYLVLNFGNVEILGYNMWAMNFQIDALVDSMVRLVATTQDVLSSALNWKSELQVFFCQWYSALFASPLHSCSLLKRMHGLFPCIIQKSGTCRQGRPQVLVPLYLLDPGDLHCVGQGL